MRSSMRLSLVFLLAILAAGPRLSTAGQLRTKFEPVGDGRLARLQRWLKAVDAHTPGFQDAPLLDVAGWANDDLRSLWVDANVLAQLMRNPGGNGFAVRADGQHASTDVRYTGSQFHRLQLLACAARGAVLDDPRCHALITADSAIHSTDGLDTDLLRISAHAAAAKFQGDDHSILRRGALFHTDIAIDPPASPPHRSSTSPSVGPTRYKMEISDGREIDFTQSAVHWDIARMLLDYVRPEHDAMARQWYRATVAWMQSSEDYDNLHLARALGIFPADPEIQFLSGCQHEAYAGPLIQHAVRNAVLPSGVRMDVGDERAELRQAEERLRRALELKADYVEARLHHGRVLGRLGRHADAAIELRQAVSSTDDPLLHFYGDLFLGAEEEALGRFDEARTLYESAARRYPRAQSSLVALSQLARRTGDRPRALDALRQALALDRDRDWHDDPWWGYYVMQARDADALLEALRAPFVAAEGRR